MDKLPEITSKTKLLAELDKLTEQLRICMEALVDCEELAQDLFGKVECDDRFRVAIIDKAREALGAVKKLEEK